LNITLKIPAVQALFFLLCFLTLIFPYEAGAEPAQPLIKAPPDVQQAYQQISDDFDLYQQFLQADETSRGPVLLNARNPDEAYVFLSRGFGSDLAAAICSSFTWYDSELECLFLIPCEGLPTIGLTEKNGVMYSWEAKDMLSFQYRFENCYQPGDAYLYRVTVRLLDGRWKIETLELFEAV
jgi:hypothetical protein